jgi:hypothetical protein
VNWAKIVTLIVMATGAAMWIGWDIYVAINDKKGDTISEVTLSFTRRHPIILGLIMLALGILIGHLFWPQVVDGGG